MTKQDRDKLLEKIAKKTLRIATLETRKGGVDFYEGDGGCVAVWNLKKAFQKAFNAGRKSRKKTNKNNISHNNWTAIVDLEENAIIFADLNKGYVIDSLNYTILPAEEDRWLEKHPECKPDDVRSALEKRFVIVNCSVTVTFGKNSK